MDKEISITSESDNSHDSPSVIAEQTQPGLFAKISNMVSDNVIYIIIGVIILGAIVYYVYIKNKNETTIVIPVQAQVQVPTQVPAQVPLVNNTPKTAKLTKKVVIKHPPIEEEYESSSETIIESDVNESDNNVSKFDLTQSELNQINEQLSQVEN
jgi:hypothetical protein